MCTDKLFWTEGIIDAIAIGGTDSPICFRLAPLAPFLFAGASGGRMLFEMDDPLVQTLFPAEPTPPQVATPPPPTAAKLVACGKNRDGREGVWFSLKECKNNGSTPVVTPELLLEAKNARCTIRLSVAEDAFGTIAKGVPGREPLPAFSLLFV